MVSSSSSMCQTPSERTRPFVLLSVVSVRTIGQTDKRILTINDSTTTTHEDILQSSVDTLIGIIVCIMWTVDPQQFDRL